MCIRDRVTGGDRNDVISLLAVGVVIVGEIFRYHVGAVIDDPDLLAEIHGCLLYTSRCV